MKRLIIAMACAACAGLVLAEDAPKAASAAPKTDPVAQKSGAPPS